VAAGWIEADAIDQMIAAQKEAEQPQELTEEERALLALNTLDGSATEEIDLGELGDLDDIDLEALAAEGGDDEAAPKE
jgi:N utilization substance protein A